MAGPETPQQAASAAPGLPLRPLGASGALVPVLGFGVSGPHAGGWTSPRLTARLIAQALEGGAALFDTAPFYGDGEAERRLGAALAGRRDGAFVCTKAGTVRTSGGLAKDFSAGGLTASLDASLRNLQTDRVDALLLHGPALADLEGEALEALADLKRAGKIRFAGVCGRGPEIEAAIASGAFDLLMLPVGGPFAEQARARAAAARARGLGLLGIEAMTGAAHGWRLPRRPADLWYSARAASRALRGEGGRRSAVTARAALNAALAGTACDAVLTTTTRAEHLAANIAVARGTEGGV